MLELQITRAARCTVGESCAKLLKRLDSLWVMRCCTLELVELRFFLVKLVNHRVSLGIGEKRFGFIAIELLVEIAHLLKKLVSGESCCFLRRTVEIGIAMRKVDQTFGDDRILIAFC